MTKREAKREVSSFMAQLAATTSTMVIWPDEDLMASDHVRLQEALDEVAYEFAKRAGPTHQHPLHIR